ncbi:hypothetical protein MYOV003v1_p0148 [Vibrio phage 207E48.1]|nr:hypothetical protein MYOV003v1_p0148 [Vibrio phage 207E48.1]
MRAARLVLFCMLLSSCKVNVAVQIPLSSFNLPLTGKIPVEIRSNVCSTGIKRGIWLDQNIVCDDNGGVWRGLIQVVDHNTKEMILKQPLSVYHGSGNGIVLYISPDALRSIQGVVKAKDVTIKVSIFNDTNTTKEVYISNIWVNDRAVGTEGGVMVVPPNVSAELQLSDVATQTLLDGGIESLAIYPIK